MITITDDHIDHIEKLLFPAADFSGYKKVFDCERREVIKCMESKDIVACAGSGKTTTLIAKLMILDRFFMAFPKNKGICVLTHTNVAIDEIKEKLGSGSRLLAYPNFFGTIQDFINTFLAKPMYRMDYKKNPKYVDLDWHGERIVKYYEEIKYSYTHIRQIEMLFPKWGADSDRKPNYPSFETLLKEMSLRDENNLLFNDEKFTSSISQEVQNDLMKFKKKFIKLKDIINYDDAYFFARRYVKQCGEGELLRKLFSQRFQFVFIDEMQDTEKHQKEILDAIFDESKTIIQRIGDNNQAIYSRSQDIAWKLKKPILSIKGSKRYHNPIAKQADNISVNQIGIEGNSSIGRKPIILVFEDTEILNVIKKFGNLVVESDLHTHDLKKYPIKAVGGLTYLSNAEGNHFIKDYFPDFEKKTSSEKEPHAYTLRDFLKHNPENQSANYYRKAIIGAMLKMLSLVGKSSYNEKEFIKEFKIKSEYNDFLLKMAQWCKKMHLNKEDIHNEVRTYLQNDLARIFSYTDNPNKTNYFLTKNETSPHTVKIKSANHKYPYKDENENILFDIEVGTVHSVKGETHTATLYLETPDYNTKEYDLKQLLEYLKGNHSTQEKFNRALRIAHVAITRPTHLLCLAIHKSSLPSFEKCKQELEAAGWEVINLE